MKFFHLRKRNRGGMPDRTGGITVAYKITKANGHTIALCALSRCSEVDVYVKRKGRDIATNRWLCAYEKKKPCDHTLMVTINEEKKYLIDALSKLLLS